MPRYGTQNEYYNARMPHVAFVRMYEWIRSDLLTNLSTPENTVHGLALHEVVDPSPCRRLSFETADSGAFTDTESSAVL